MPGLLGITLLVVAASAVACGDGTQENVAANATPSQDGSARTGDGSSGMNNPSSADVSSSASDVPASAVPDAGVPGPDGASPRDAPAASADAITRLDAVVDPAGLNLTMIAFLNLPINSVRFMVRGYDPVHSLCVEIIWDYSNTGHTTTRHCDDFGVTFPYVFIAPGACPVGDTAHYGGNAEVLSANGCIDFKGFTPQSTDSVDVTVNVRSDLFTGTILARN